MAGASSMSSTDAPERLVRLALGGDEHAFARIVRLHHADMVRVCFVVCGDADVARESVAATWPLAWRRLGRLREPGRLRPWLCSVAVEEARRRIRPPAVAHLAPRTSDPDLADALGRLEPGDRLMLALRYVVGLGVAELEPAIRVRALDDHFDGILGRLGRELGGAGTQPTLFEPQLERRLQAYADIPVRPVDADSVARATHAEMVAAGNHLPSVAVAALVAALFMAVVYVIAANSPPAPVPTPIIHASTTVASPHDRPQSGRRA